MRSWWLKKRSLHDQNDFLKTSITIFMFLSELKLPTMILFNLFNFTSWSNKKRAGLNTEAWFPQHKRPVWWKTGFVSMFLLVVTWVLWWALLLFPLHHILPQNRIRNLADRLTMKQNFYQLILQKGIRLSRFIAECLSILMPTFVSPLEMHYVNYGRLSDGFQFRLESFSYTMSNGFQLSAKHTGLDVFILTWVCTIWL